MTRVNSSQATKDAKRLREYEAKSKRLEDGLAKARFSFNDDSRRLVAGLVALHPKISSLAWEQVYPFLLKVFFDDVGTELEIERFYELCPSRETYENLLWELAAESVMINVHSLNKVKKFFLAFDKGDASNGKAGPGKSYRCLSQRTTCRHGHRLRYNWRNIQRGCGSCLPLCEEARGVG
jgi:hypothetical protein